MIHWLATVNPWAWILIGSGLVCIGWLFASDWRRVK